MFFRKLVVLLLLGFYGVPAAIGPHWHHHRCTEHACVSHDQTHSHQAAVPAKASCHCSCEHHHAAAQNTAANGSGRNKAVQDEQRRAPKTPAWTEASLGEHGPCAICAFYASAQSVAVSFTASCHSELVTSLALLDVSAPSTSLHEARVRGPPVL